MNADPEITDFDRVDDAQRVAIMAWIVYQNQTIAGVRLARAKAEETALEQHKKIVLSAT